MRSLALFLALAGNQAQAESDARLVVECDRNQVFQGELFSCNYVLYAPADQLELEVAKFPEFRGFWSENTALRQGPMLLMPVPGFPILRKALIGSYHLLPMVGVKEPTLTPMRLVLRGMGMEPSADETVLLSELASPLQVRPLPPVPEALKQDFQNAVGEFTLRAEASHLRYFPGEPVAVRFFLTGRGNFPELNSLPVTLPTGMEALSWRTTAMGSAQSQTKVFELLMTVQSENLVDFPGIRLVYFDPFERSYRSVSTAPIRLEPMQRPPEIIDPEAIDMGPVQPDWTTSQPLQRRKAFFLLQILAGLVWLFLVALRLFSAWQSYRATNPRWRLKREWKMLLGEGASEQALLDAAATLLFQTVALKSKHRLTTWREAARFAERRWDAKTADQLREIFRAQEQRRFSPESVPHPTSSDLRRRLAALSRRLLTS